MKYNPFLQKILIAAFLLAAASGYAQTLSAWLSDMKEIHPAYSRVRLDREIAELTRTKSLITAATEEERMNAEIAYTAALSSLGTQLKSFYEDVADAAFTVAIVNADLEIAEIRRKIASDSYARAETHYQQGLVSAESLEERRIALTDAEKVLVRAREADRDANRYFAYTTGLTWKPEITNLFTLFSWLPEEEIWRNADYGLKRAGFQVRLARERFAALPDNAPTGDRRMREIALEQAALVEKAAVFDADRSFSRALLNLNTYRRQAELEEKKRDLERKQTEDMRRRFQQGAVSEQEYDQKRIMLLQAQRNTLNALLEYTVVLFNAVVSTGVQPEDALIEGGFK